MTDLQRATIGLVEFHGSKRLLAEATGVNVSHIHLLTTGAAGASVWTCRKLGLPDELATESRTVPRARDNAADPADREAERAAQAERAREVRRDVRRGFAPGRRRPGSRPETTADLRREHLQRERRLGVGV